MFLLNGNTAELTMDDMLLSDPISAMQYAQGTLSISEEAIAFQSSSKVGKRMVAFFEDCYKIREEKYNGHIDGDRSDNFNCRMRSDCIYRWSRIF